MKLWEELSPMALGVMEDMGNFSPTVHADRKEVKGCQYDDGEAYKSYLDSQNLRDISAACIEVADWLDTRAASAQEGGT
jgi:hypothetical protein